MTAKTIKFQTSHNYTVSEGVKSKKPSMTQPDQVYTLKELLERQKNGIPIQGQHMEYIEGETPLPIINDLTDLMAIGDQLSEIEADYKEKIARLKERKQSKPEPETEPNSETE